MSRLVTLCLLAVCALGCGKHIGDACSVNTDCANDGTRFCDNAPVGGYCTVEGCDTDTCPDGAVCVRFYTPVLDKRCDYDPCNAVGSCSPDERCVCDQSNDNDVTSMACAETGQSGVACNVAAHCAPENSERRWCMKKCGGDDDCRNRYECRATGTLGAEPVPSLEKPYGKPAKFCVSTGQ